MTTTTQDGAARGGATYGQGKYGRTMDVVGDRDDPDTLHAALSTAPTTPPWVAYVHERAPFRASSAAARFSTRTKTPVQDLKAIRQRRMKVEAMAALVQSVSKKDGEFAGMVAKEMRDTPAFEEELRMNDRVLRAYGKAAHAYTTLRTLKVALDGQSVELVGIRVPATGTMYTLQTRCDVPLDRFDFARTPEVLEFVKNIEDSFAILHAAGFLHADVKRDNMIFCRGGKPPLTPPHGTSRGSAPPGGSGKGVRGGIAPSFKLIDWGGSTSVERLRRRYLGKAWVRPKNCLTPMAWFIYGAERVSSLIFFGRALTLHSDALTSSNEFRTFLASAFASTEDEIQRLIAASPASLDQAAARRLAFKLHWRSFDLFNFGLIVAEIACTTRGGMGNRKVHADLMQMAVRLTHYVPPPL